jgi:hypothetical protein
MATRRGSGGWRGRSCSSNRSALVVYSTNASAAAHVTSPGLRFDASPEANVLAIVNGLIILVVAEVFMAGTRLDDDRSLT